MSKFKKQTINKKTSSTAKAHFGHCLTISPFTSTFSYCLWLPNCFLSVPSSIPPPRKNTDFASSALVINTVIHAYPLAHLKRTAQCIMSRYTRVRKRANNKGLSYACSTLSFTKSYSQYTSLCCDQLFFHGPNT